MKSITLTRGTATHRVYCLIAEIPSTHTELLAELMPDADGISDVSYRSALNDALRELRKSGACIRREVGNMGMCVWEAVPTAVVNVVDPRIRTPEQLCMLARRGRPPKPSPKIRRLRLRAIKLEQIPFDF